MAQIPLYLAGMGEPIQTLVISQQREFDKLFEGFRDMRAISYVSSAELVLELLDRWGFDSIELLVGENIAAKQLKDDLLQRTPTVVERLASELEAGKLRILTPKRTIHTKFYILRGRDDGRARVIITSANLTQTARRATGQTNYAWYMDLAEDDPMLRRAE